MAGVGVTAAALHELRHVVVAWLEPVRTAWVERRSPDGMLINDGGDPWIGIKRVPFESTVGMDSRRPHVYGCSGLLERLLRGADLDSPSRVHHHHALGDVVR